MIVSVDTCYLSKEDVLKLSSEDYEILRTISDAADVRSENRYGVSTNSLIHLEEDGPKFERFGLSVRIKKFPGQMRVVVPGVPETAGEVRHVHVHVPNIGLLQVDEVTNLDDACTDELAKFLDSGWRILCVCPPNNQRRPDYILGRTKSDRSQQR